MADTLPTSALEVPQSRSWRWPRFRLRPVLGVLAFCLVVGVSYGAAVRLDQLANGHTSLPASRAFFWEITGALSAWVTLPLIQTATLNAPSPRASGWARFLGLHVVGFALYTSVHILVMLGIRYLLYPLLGWGEYEYGPMAFRLPMEVSKDLIAYGLAVTFISLFTAWRNQHARALREAELEGELRSAQLQSLTGQLHPHFLFNSLHTISSVMYEDLARTDRLLSDLGHVLRASLERAEPTWTLAEERAHTARFVGLLSARFGDRLAVHWSVEPGLDSARVPCFALQTLVENAVKHNQDRVQPLEVRIRASETAGTWRLEVEDTGRGFGGESPASGTGVGLAHLEQILALLHDGRARLERGQGPEGGARVSLTLPLGAKP
ncbi:histidine kinase [Myxococcus sp. CA051A]|uniref:sensor histidine kinase n=1 Tax=unclassified Myxococcus TaxID=2648731 RepID=UPI00157A5A99|nr:MULTISPECIES: histidine kinase [unclassified Myxococcus]NTX12075.1 histidine kinase [Myxococcus sp. CA056]NTX59846.1 histidine kinase [Myxococcus sp. CA051A]